MRPERICPIGSQQSLCLVQRCVVGDAVMEPAAVAAGICMIQQFLCLIGPFGIGCPALCAGQAQHNGKRLYLWKTLQNSVRSFRCAMHQP